MRYIYFLVLLLRMDSWAGAQEIVYGPQEFKVSCYSDRRPKLDEDCRQQTVVS